MTRRGRSIALAVTCLLLAGCRGQTALSLTTTTTTNATDGELISRLSIAPAGAITGYDRLMFEPHGWADANRDGCDTRAEVLIRDSRVRVTKTKGCTVTAGDWVSLYDNYSTPDPTELDIDHVVALGEAWRSGAKAWAPEHRLEFGQDLDNLLEVTAAMNRSKGDRDPAVWQPPNRAGWCAFSRRWVKVKVKWHLTADANEVRVLKIMLGTC